MVKKLLLPVIFLLLVTLTACGAKENPAESGNTQIANPWVDCATLQEAADLVGFDLSVPDGIDGYPDRFIQAIEKDMIQVLYFSAKADEEERVTVLIRKASGERDISGDYNEYREISVETVGGADVQLSGNDGLVYNAIWTEDGYSYAILAGEGLEKGMIAALIGQVQ